MNIYQITPALVVQGNIPEGAPNSIIGARIRPKGLTRLRQKLVRGYNEIAYPIPTIFKYLTAQARLEHVPYASRAHTPQSPDIH